MSDNLFVNYLPETSPVSILEHTTQPTLSHIEKGNYLCLGEEPQ